MPVEWHETYAACCDLPEADCEWSWLPENLSGDDAGCEVELCVHMLQEHQIKRKLPSGYGHLQEKLDIRIRAVSADSDWLAGLPGCLQCGKGFVTPARVWGLCWDGRSWRMYEYLPGMRWGPLHGGSCVSGYRASLPAGGPA